MERLTHSFEPVYDRRSRILILGTFPSVKSRESQFYYGHPQNRFWRVLSNLTGEPVPSTVGEKKRLLFSAGIAVWDVIASCEIQGSSDSSIRDVVPNDLSGILDDSPIERLFANGDKAFRLYNKYCHPDLGREIIRLPSTSPANAACSLERLTSEWGAALHLTHYL